MNLTVLLLLTSIAANSTSYESINSDITRELTELRAESQKVFLLDDGNYELRYYSSPVHYWDGNEFLEFEDAEFRNNVVGVETNSKLNYSIIENDYISNLNSSSNVNSTEVINVVSNNISQEKNYLDDYVPTYNTYHNEYYLSDDGYYVFPNSIASNSENSLMNASNYSVSNDSNLTLINETIASEITYNPVFQDKYITLGISGSTNSTGLLAGTDSLQIMDENFNVRNAEYVSVFGIDVPDINPDSIESASLYICKNTTTNNANRNPTVYLNKVTSNITFDNIGGTTSFNSSFLKTGMGSNQSYNFDIKDAVVDSLEADSELVLTLEGSSTGYASFYASESSSSNVPYVSIIVDSSYIGSTPYGDAPAYREVTSTSVNCLGYALLLNYGVDLCLESYGTTIDYDTTYNAIVSTITSKNYEIREIDSYDSAIYSDERRIAFRHNPRQSSSWHFVMQNSDGTWAAKVGAPGQSGCYSQGLTPESDTMWNMYQDLIGKNTYYYAIR